MPSSPTHRKLISIVIPFLDEEAAISCLFKELRATLLSLNMYRWELVLVDDGSTDKSIEQIRTVAPQFPGVVCVLRLSRNFGHQSALMAGVGHARGEAIICLDADLQDPPRYFTEFLRLHYEGYDVVYGVRKSREGSVLKRMAYWTFYRLFHSVSEIDIPLDAGDFGLISRRVADVLGTMSDSDVLVRGLRSWVGFRQIGVPYARKERAAGSTKYSIRKLLRLAASAFFGYSALPLRFATALGLISLILVAIYGSYTLFQKVVGRTTPSGWASTILVVLFLGGVQLISVGILGEYIIRIYRQSLRRPLYVIAETITLTEGVFNNSR